SVTASRLALAHWTGDPFKPGFGLSGALSGARTIRHAQRRLPAPRGLVSSKEMRARLLPVLLRKSLLLRLPRPCLLRLGRLRLRPRLLRRPLLLRYRLPRLLRLPQILPCTRRRRRGCCRRPNGDRSRRSRDDRAQASSGGG